MVLVSTFFCNFVAKRCNHVYLLSNLLITYMNRLNGKTFIIGREEGQQRLMLAWPEAPGGKPNRVLLNINVPQSVSRCLPQAGGFAGHLKLQVHPDGNIVVSNNKPNNHTYVNGMEIASRLVSPADEVELGPQKFKVQVNKLLDAALKLMPGGMTPPPGGNGGQTRTVNIRHLEKVWETYDNGRMAVAARQRRLNLVRGIIPVFSMSSMVVRFSFDDKTIQTVSMIFLVLSLLGVLYSFFVMKQDDATQKNNELLNDLQDNYTCPECQKFLGNMRYTMLKKQTGMQCPYCKSKFVE